MTSSRGSARPPRPFRSSRQNRRKRCNKSAAAPPDRSSRSSRALSTPRSTRSASGSFPPTIIRPARAPRRSRTYIDLLVSESPADIKTAWTEGLTALDQASTERFKAPFVKATAEQQIALLTDISRNELDPKTPLEVFFREAKSRTITGYYTSKIGIHQELGYKGNQFLPEFVGYAEQS